VNWKGLHLEVWVQIWRMKLRAGSYGEDMWPPCREHGVAVITHPPIYDIDLTKLRKADLEEVLQLAMESPAPDEAIEMLSGTDAWIRLSVRCDVSAANRLQQFVREFLDLSELDEDKVAIASKEMLLNAMEHGGKFDPEQRIEIAYLRARQVVLIRIKDPGDGFSFKENLDTAANNPPDDPLRHLKHREAQGIRPGGYGILLAKNLVDEVFYGEKGNDVLLIKYINDERKGSASPVL
jgi:anti-sigma regulatory factor (Ser/Thr protein kinase)